VLISRGSLDFFKVKRLWILIALQIVNFVLWFLNVYYFSVTHYAIVFVHIAIVGMMGGTLYVNVLYNIITSRTLDYNDKELAMIMCTIFDDLGILTASLTALALDNTLFKEYQTTEVAGRLLVHFMIKSSRR
jgi:battenin